ncbi:MAG: hypothetical protein QOK42_2485 [Frankiaceae bacterium]|nr:hypothetical protein [Frankiaceae bacterium]MDX6225579.1 hypothetical protein [Frankiales bacterium]MDX6273144.1 hypothetical protein [Frankiales bacterium]
MTAKALPAGIDKDRHLNLRGREHHVWIRRAGVLLVGLVPLLALLNVFGQQPSYSTVKASQATLRVDSPGHVRGGLIFTTHLTITPHQELRDMRVLLDSGWFRGMTFNGLSPQPETESSSGRWEVYDFGQVSAGVPFSIWISWQTNPTNVGRHNQDIALTDGDNRILVAHRSLMVFP